MSLGFFKVNNLINVLWGNVSFGFMVLGIFFVFVTGGMDLSIESTFAIAPIIGAMAMFEMVPGNRESRGRHNYHPSC